jgi:hypothetical protein
MAIPFAQGIYGDFSKTTVGLADMKLASITAGFLKDGLKCMFDNKVLDFMVSTPLQFAGRTVIEYAQTVSGNFAQIDAFQISKNLGQGAGGIATISAGVSSWPPAGVSNVLPVVTLANGAKGVYLPGGNITAPVFKTPDGTTHTYVLNTDYILEPGSNFVNGSIEVIPGSVLATAVTGGQGTLWGSFSIGQAGSLRVYPGAVFNFETTDCLITHKRPNNGKYIKVYMPKVMFMGQSVLNFAEGKYMLQGFEAKAIPDGTYIDDQGTPAPYGYIDVQQ